MINARSLTTLGIGFGVVAIATLGIITDKQQPVIPVETVVLGGGGGTGFEGRYRISRPPTYYRDPKRRDPRVVKQENQIIEFICKFVTEYT